MVRFISFANKGTGLETFKTKAAGHSWHTLQVSCKRIDIYRKKIPIILIKKIWTFNFHWIKKVNKIIWKKAHTTSSYHSPCRCGFEYTDSIPCKGEILLRKGAPLRWILADFRISRTSDYFFDYRINRTNGYLFDTRLNQTCLHFDLIVNRISVYLLIRCHFYPIKHTFDIK